MSESLSADFPVRMFVATFVAAQILYGTWWKSGSLVTTIEEKTSL